MFRAADRSNGMAVHCILERGESAESRYRILFWIRTVSNVDGGDDDM